MLGFTGGIALLAAVGFGLLPALQSAASDPTAGLKEGGRGPAAPRRHLTGVLVIAETALALMLMAGAALMLNTLWRLQHVELGFDADRLVTMQVRLPHSYDAQKAAVFFPALIDRVRALPGVVAAGASNTLPMGGAPTFGGFSIDGDLPRSPDAAPPPTAGFRTVTPDYFRTLGIPLRSGRVFTDADRLTSPRVAVVNETMEREYLGGNAIGRESTQGNGRARIVGVVGDIRHRTLRSRPEAEIYHPLAQTPRTAVWLAVRSGGRPDALVAAIGKTVRAIDTNAVVSEIKTMEERRAESLGTSCLLLVLLVGFAALALVLALVGSYGVVNYSVSRRAHEFGVRMAMGAPRWRVEALVLRETLVLAGGALVLGTAGALAASRMLGSFLYEVTPTDPATLSAAALLVLGAALVAGWLPARRASRTDPVEALREG